MSSLWKRLFSSSYRKALKAEAGGDYVGAAESYALAGMPAKVAEMHLVRAGRVEPAKRIGALLDALRWLRGIEGEEFPETVATDLASALIEEAKALPEGDPRRINLATEAAKLYEMGDKKRDAGLAFELIGQKDEAARCYEEAGDIEGMERLLDADSNERRAKTAARDAFDDYEVAMVSGARDHALTALRRCCVEAPGQGYARMLERLERRLPPTGTLEIRLDGIRMILSGAAPSYLGRGDAHLRLRHPGISRRHAAIDMDSEGFAVRDAGSRNGTKLGGLPLAGRVPLEGSGTIGLGTQCTLQFSVSDAAVDLEVLDGPDRGLKAVLLARPWAPPRSPFLFSFKDGMARVEEKDGAPLVLNDKKTTSTVVLLRSDVVEALGGGRIEVL